eukprot:794844_1
MATLSRLILSQLIYLTASIDSDCNGGACTPLTTVEKQAILDLHNELRDRVAGGGLVAEGHPAATNMNSLIWDDGLAAVAQTYVESCPGLGHNDDREFQIKYQRDATTQNTKWGTKNGPTCSTAYCGSPSWSSTAETCIPIGELSRVGSGVAYDLSDIITQIETGWWNGYTKWTYGMASDGCSDASCGEYTQMVWANTRYVGCGYVNGCSGTWNAIFVCNYFPAGNFNGASYPPYTNATSANECSECDTDRTQCKSVYVSQSDSAGSYPDQPYGALCDGGVCPTMCDGTLSSLSAPDFCNMCTPTPVNRDCNDGTVSISDGRDICDGAISNPTSFPSSIPTASPTTNPSLSPSQVPSVPPTQYPTISPTSSSAPTASQTSNPTNSPTVIPIASASDNPTTSPTSFPSSIPTTFPSSIPTVSPTLGPTDNPTASPISGVSNHPTLSPLVTLNPSSFPTTSPSQLPSALPTMAPTQSMQSVNPTSSPSQLPTENTREDCDSNNSLEMDDCDETYDEPEGVCSLLIEAGFSVCYVDCYTNQRSKLWNNVKLCLCHNMFKDTGFDDNKSKKCYIEYYHFGYLVNGIEKSDFNCTVQQKIEMSTGMYNEDCNYLSDIAKWLQSADNQQDVINALEQCNLIYSKQESSKHPQGFGGIVSGHFDIDLRDDQGNVVNVSIAFNQDTYSMRSIVFCVIFVVFFTTNLL